MALTGMDIEQVKSLGNLLQQKKGEIEQLVAQIEGSIGNTTWLGPDADRFRNDWWPQHRTSLRQIGEALHGFGQSAINNALEQADTSNR